jgi:hypothetical protein
VSVRYVKAVLDGPKTLKHGKLAVMQALAEWAGEDGRSWYPVVRVAERARLNIRATQYALKALEEAGFISIEHGVGRGNPSVYTINLEALQCQEQQPEKVQKGAILDSTEKVQSSALNGANSDTKGAVIEEKVQFSTEKGANSLARVKPPVNHQEEPSLTAINHPAHASEHVTHASTESELSHVDERGQSLRQILRAEIADVAPSRYANFEDFFLAFWQALPRQSKVDKPAVRTAARDLAPSLWETVATAAANYRESDIVKRGRARNALNWLAGEAWEAYADGPIVESAAEPPPTAADLKARDVIDMADAARRRQGERNAQRQNGHLRLNGGGHR